MAGSLNKVMLIGNVGVDPEIRSTADGKKIATLRIATSDRWKDKATGERQERTEWHRVVVFSPVLSEIIEKYVKKGMRVYIEGQLQTRKWTDQENKERFTTEVVVSPFSGQVLMLTPSGQQASVANGDNESLSNLIDDDVPF